MDLFAFYRCQLRPLHVALYWPVCIIAATTMMVVARTGPEVEEKAEVVVVVV